MLSDAIWTLLQDGIASIGHGPIINTLDLIELKDWLPLSLDQNRHERSMAIDPTTGWYQFCLIKYK